jgi:hypothetical protein
MQKRYGVNLTDQERAGPEGVVRGRGAIGSDSERRYFNVAEMQLSVLSRQALHQRIASLPRLRAILRAWHTQHPPTAVRWRFTTQDARIRLLHLSQRSSALLRDGLASPAVL